ncbi:hypothetical protein HXS80_20605 [Streptomyces sp. CB04723]|nr:hypothetical protein [Streptomyces sp. CB04723]QLG33805.1 hypothetical protein HXS80_20605 [Streptomyces sp. CB04723]
MQAMRLLIALAASALAIGNAADGNSFTAVCWALAAVLWIVMIVLAEDGR